MIACTVECTPVYGMAGYRTHCRMSCMMYSAGLMCGTQSNNIQLEECTLKFRFWRLFRTPPDWVSTSTPSCALGPARLEVLEIDTVRNRWSSRASPHTGVPMPLVVLLLVEALCRP